MAVKIGKVGSPRGLKGEVQLFLTAADVIAEGLEVILSIGNKKTKYQISKVSKQPKKTYVFFEGVNDRNASELLKGAEVFVEDDAFQSEEGDELFLRELLNFEVRVGSLRGKVVGFSSNGPQDLITVQWSHDSSESLIPLIKEFILELNMAQKFINLQLPEGLLEL